MNIFIGIDNGLAGGIVGIDKNMIIKYKFIMPVIKGKKTEYDVKGIYDIFNKIKFENVESNISVVLEKAHVRPVSGKRASFSTGLGYGIMQAMLECFKFPYEIVRPKEWQKEILKGINTGDTKTDAIKFCKRKWPNVDWTPTDRSKKEHTGLTDAACMSLFNLRRSK